MNDYFQSHTISLILTWVFSIPIILGMISAGINILFKKTEGTPRSLTVWLVICVLLFSPFRYILLQLFIATAYPFQSFRALLTTCILAFYIPIVFSILYVIGLGLPLLGTMAVAGFKNRPSKMRLCLSAIAAPIIFLIGGWLYYLVLPYAAYSTHWLNSGDVIRATNGPPEYIYKYVVEQMTPIQFPGYVHKIGFDKLSPKQRLRSHVAAVYLGEKEFSFFVYKSYPEEFRRKTGYKD
jgi:hypothetical protein